MTRKRNCSEKAIGQRPPKDENGQYIFWVRKACLGEGCDRDFRTKDPSQPFCRRCRKRSREEADHF